MASNSGTKNSLENVEGDFRTEISDEYVEGKYGTEISDEYVNVDSGSWISGESVEGAYLLQKSGLRFSQGIRSMTMLADLMEDYFKCEERTAHALQEYTCDWTKKMADLASSGNGDLWKGSIYSAITKVLMEPIEDAKISNLVKKEGFDNNGPVTFLRSWKEKMERSHIPKDTFKLYTTAWKRQISAVMEIQKAMEYYHWRKYKLENGLRLLQAKPPVLSFRAEEKLRKSISRYQDKCQNAQEQYKRLLIMEEAGRGQRMANIRTAKLKFGRFEKTRMMNTEVGIEKFLNILEKLDMERANHQGLLQDIHALLDKMDVETDVRNLMAQNINQHKYPVFVEFDDKTPYQEREINNWLKREKVGAGPDDVIKRKRNKQCDDPTVVITDRSDPNLVMKIRIYGDDSDDIKKGTNFDTILDEDENEESVIEIFEIDENGREIKMNHKPKPMTADALAHDNHEKLNKGNSIKVKVAPRTKYFVLPNAVESNNERGMWAIPMRDRTIDLNVESGTSPVLPKLTRKGKKLMKKTRKGSADSTKPIKESRKVKDKGITEVNVDKRVDKDKVLETVTELNLDSDTDTKVPDVAEVRTLANVKVIATEDYIARNRDELTLKVGKKIKQKIPANSDGMAYGWIRKGKLRKKIYGYYPANLVELRPKKQKTGIRGMLSKERQILKSES